MYKAIQINRLKFETCDMEHAFHGIHNGCAYFGRHCQYFGQNYVMFEAGVVIDECLRDATRAISP